MSAANSDKTVKKVIGRPFKPGQSGNPLGRPKLPDWFVKGGPDALKFMMEVAQGKKEDEKISRYEACREMADRIYYKPPQGVTLPMDEDGRPAPVVFLPVATVGQQGQVILPDARK